MPTFKAAQVLTVNSKTFTITKTSSYTVEGNTSQMLHGTLEGEPKFLAGTRSIVANELVLFKNGNFKYDWNAL